MTTLYETPLYRDGPNPAVDFSTEEHGAVEIEQTRDGDFILRARRENVDADTIAEIVNDVATHDEFDNEAVEIAFEILAAAKEAESNEDGEDDTPEEKESETESDEDNRDDGDDEPETIALPNTTETVEQGERLHHTGLNADMVVLGELRYSRVSIRAGANDPEKWLKQDLRDKLADGTLQRTSTEVEDQ